MKAALENYESAASRGHGRAALFAGHIYYSQSVDGDSLDFTEAAKFYLQAAENGVAEAMNALAILLEDGRGTVDGTPNVFAAAAWFYESGMCGYGHQAFFNLAMLLSSGTVHAFLSIDGRLITLETAREVLYEKLSEESYGPKGLAAINLLENVYNNPNTFNTLNGSYYNESYNDSYDNDEERQGGESNRNRNGNFEDNEDKILTRLSNYSRNNYNIRSYTVNKRPANNTNYNSDRPSFQKGADRYSSVNSSLNSSLNDSSVLYNSETRANNSNMNDDGTPSGELIEKSYNYRPKVNESSNLDSFREHKSEGIVEKNFVHEITKGQNIETECGNSSIEWVSVPASMNKPQNFEVSKPGKPPLQRETSEGPVAFAGEAFDRSLTSDNSTNNSNIDREIDTAKNTVRNTNGLAPEDITDSRTRDSKTQVANHVQANGSVDDHSDGLTSATSSRSSGFSESKAYTNNAESLPHRQHFSMREQPNIPPLTTKEKMERSNSAHLEHQQSLLRGQELLLLSNDEDDPQLRNETPPFDAPLQTTTPNKTTVSSLPHHCCCVNCHTCSKRRQINSVLFRMLVTSPLSFK